MSDDDNFCPYCTADLPTTSHHRRQYCCQRHMREMYELRRGTRQGVTDFEPTRLETFYISEDVRRRARRAKLKGSK